MKTPHSRPLLRIGAALVAAAAAAMTLVVPASADVNLVDPTEVASLTIHKFEAPTTPLNLPNNGTEQTVGLNPLAGVGFTIYKVDPIDLTTNAGWVEAGALAQTFNGTVPAPYTTTQVGDESFTDPEGDIVLVGLELGLYYVVETSPLPGSTAVAPFLVTLPLTDPVDTDEWLYDVHVYPKNALTTATKTVQDATDAKLGDQIDFTITADIPNVLVIDAYKIVDALDPKLTFDSAAVALSDADPVLVPGVDYTVSPSGSTEVTIEFTPAGLLVLAANTADQVVVTLTTTVDAEGEITNQALVYPNAFSYNVGVGQPGGPTPTNEVVTKWGNYTLTKVSNDATPVLLSGAVFSVYLTEADARAGTNALSLGDPAQTTFSTGVDGLVTFEGLRYSDWANGAAVAVGEPGYQSYWFAEVIAPDGYELLADPIEFTVTAGTTVPGSDLTVTNVPSNGGFELPSTGGTGSLIFWIGGGALLVGALFLGLHGRRSAAARR